jgi:CDP-diacylglycerol---glycerol-3-phosphate 3-phosphatidyltransferase
MPLIEEKKKRNRRLELRELLNLPNFITYARISLVPVIAFLLLPLNDGDDRFNNWDRIASFASAILFLVAAVSDSIDGYFARKYNLTSTFGKFIDPLADKLLSFTALIILVDLSRVPAWIVILLVSRDITITSLRAVAADDGVVIEASQWGKYKTFMGSFALAFLIAHYSIFGLNIHGIGMVLLSFTFLISMGSGVHYIYKFFSGISRKS